MAFGVFFSALSIFLLFSLCISSLPAEQFSYASTTPKSWPHDYHSVLGFDHIFDHKQNRSTRRQDVRRVWKSRFCVAERARYHHLLALKKHSFRTFCLGFAQNHTKNTCTSDFFILKLQKYKGGFLLFCRMIEVFKQCISQPAIYKYPFIFLSFYGIIILYFDIPT